jgi:hypothetical protein
MRKPQVLGVLFISIIFLCLIVATAFPKGAAAQEPYEGDLYLPIRIIDTNWKDENLLTFSFMVDLGMLRENNQYGLSELSITTNQGVVNFDPAQLKDPKQTMAVGTLDAPNLPRFQASKVVGTLDGTVYDFTENAYNSKMFLPEIDFARRHGKVCPNTTLDLSIIEGVYLGVECGDYCHAYFTVNGKNVEYFYEGHLSYFFDDPASKNKKIKAQVREYIAPPEEGDSDCSRGVVITDFVVVK